MDRGSQFEDRAAQLLRGAGLRVLERNFRCKLGELDLVCREGEVLVFVEVRYRSNPHFASAAASVTPAKQRRLWRTAQFYLQRHGLTDSQACRFDVIAFSGSREEAEDGIQWLKNAITM